MEKIARQLSFLGSDLVSEMMKVATLQHVSVDKEILSTGHYVHALPLVIDGLVKVCSRFGERELLLYYMQPLESCVMSLSAILKNETSRIFAVTETDSTLLLLPTDKVMKWIRQYPRLNTLFYQQYSLRYNELLDTINELLLNKMDRRLYEYLIEKSRLTNKSQLWLTHNQIAHELGTVREVVSRVMKKLEAEGKVKQVSSSIILSEW